MPLRLHDLQQEHLLRQIAETKKIVVTVHADAVGLHAQQHHLETSGCNAKFLERLLHAREDVIEGNLLTPPLHIICQSDHVRERVPTRGRFQQRANAAPTALSMENRSAMSKGDGITH